MSMTDVYIYRPGWRDYSTIGVCGRLTPTRLEWDGAYNALPEIVMEHPLDALGRFQLIQEDWVLRVPVPVRVTPEIRNGQFVTSVEIAHVADTAAKAQRYVYSDREEGDQLKLLKKGAKVTVVSAPENSDRWKIKNSQVKGWIDKTALEIDENVSIPGTVGGMESVSPSWVVRDQMFRIYSVTKTDTLITAYARGIAGDSMYNLTTYDTNGRVELQTALDNIVSHCLDRCRCELVTNITGQRAGYHYRDWNPIAAILDPDEGLAARCDAEVIFENQTVFMLFRAGGNRGYRIEYAKNLSGVDMSISVDEVVTHVRPKGQTKDGKPLYLTDNQGLIECPNASAYPFKRIKVLDVEDAVVSDDVSTSVARARLLAEGTEYAQSGIDAPTVSATISLLDLGDTPRYQQYKDLAGVFLYDTIKVYYPRLNIDILATVSRVKWDCLRGRINAMQLGETLNLTSQIKVWQLSGLISGGHLQWGSVDSRSLADGAVSERTIQAESITAEKIAADSIEAQHIKAGEIEAQHIAAEAIEAQHIKAGEIETEHLAAGAITAEKIDAGAITAEKIDAGAITTEKLDAGAITADKIDAGAITAEKLAAHAIDADAIAAIRADIRELVAGTITTDQLYADLAAIATAQITTAHMNSATIDWASITSLAADVAEIAQAEISQATIGTAQIENLSATIATIATAQITTAALQNANIQWANISNLAASIASIADAQIGSASITTAQISDLTAQIASVVNLAAQNGDFNFAKVASLVAGAMILSEGVGGSVCIDNLAATSAMMVSATLGELVLKGTDNKYYNVSVDADGTLHTQQTTVTSAEISAGETSTGKAIVSTSANIANLNAQTVKAQSAILSDIFAAALQAEKISANQAFLASAAIPELRATVISALEDKLTLKGSQVIFEAGDTTAEGALSALSSRLTVSEDGLEQVSTHMNEVDGTVDKVNSFFRFDLSDPTAPVLTMGSTKSPMSMKLSNTKLSFLWNGSEVAYFSDNKLYVTNVEAIERLSVGTSANGYLDEVTTATGVGFLWRAS